jgi:ectoine hydroxylase-related dioxygenase (phytanoyl-CoA dioxygenase family)
MFNSDLLTDFSNDGYIIINKLLNSQEISVISQKANSLKSMALDLSQTLNNSQINKIEHQGTQFVIQNDNDHTIIHRIVWAGGAEPELLNFSRQNKLLNIVGSLLETKQANHIINQLHFKMPGDKVEFSWHQDIHHRRDYDPNWHNMNQDKSYVVCITAIDPMTLENGPIMLVPDSHKSGEVLRDTLTDKFDLNTYIPLLLDPGDTACMHQYLVHGSDINNSTNSRIVLINGFAFIGSNHAKYPGNTSGEIIDLFNKNIFGEEL